MALFGITDVFGTSINIETKSPIFLKLFQDFLPHPNMMKVVSCKFFLPYYHLSPTIDD